MEIRDTYCFGCGQENPIGLKLAFQLQENRYIAVKTLPKEYQGYDGIVHGGILSTMMDEAMAGYLNKALGQKAVTARLDIRYRQPAPVGVPLTIASWEESRRGSFVNMKASIATEDGTIVTEATGKMALVNTDTPNA